MELVRNEKFRPLPGPTNPESAFGAGPTVLCCSKSAAPQTPLASLWTPRPHGGVATWVSKSRNRLCGVLAASGRCGVALPS